MLFPFRRRRKARQEPFSNAWRERLDRNVRVYARLPADARRALEGHIHVFLREKTFEGCGGFTVTDEVRMTVAAQACLLLLGRDMDYFPRLRSILVYPTRYVAHTAHRQPDGTVIEGPQTRAGESWFRGAVVLSWDDVLRGAADVDDGRNVVFHEFAHQLDSESGAIEGAPALGRRSRYLAWARVLGREYRRLQADLANHGRTLLDTYGAGSPAEFFAVVTEAFFEQPVALKRRHTALYEQLASFYKQDPAARHE